MHSRGVEITRPGDAFHDSHHFVYRLLRTRAAIASPLPLIAQLRIRCSFSEIFKQKFSYCQI